MICTVLDNVDLFVGCWGWGQSLWVDGGHGGWCVDCDLDGEATGDGSGCDMASPCGIGSSLFDKHVNWDCCMGAVHVLVSNDVSGCYLS